MWRRRSVSLALVIVALMLPPDTSGALVQSAPSAGAKPKVFAAVYERGPAYLADKPVFQQPSIEEHIKHHEALADRLIAAGPLNVRPDDRVIGIIVFEAESVEAAEQWLGKDPAVMSKVMNATVRQWGVSMIRMYQK